MLDIDISSCQTVEEIRTALEESVKGHKLVETRREAKKHFRSKGIGGHVNETVIFRHHKEIPAESCLRRNLLVCALIFEYMPENEPSEKAYSLEIITY